MTIFFDCLSVSLKRRKIKDRVIGDDGHEIWRVLVATQVLPTQLLRCTLALQRSLKGPEVKIGTQTGGPIIEHE
jgi:hypothetical protein